MLAQREFSRGGKCRLLTTISLRLNVPESRPRVLGMARDHDPEARSNGRTRNAEANEARSPYGAVCTKARPTPDGVLASAQSSESSGASLHRRGQLHFGWTSGRVRRDTEERNCLAFHHRLSVRDVMPYRPCQSRMLTSLKSPSCCKMDPKIPRISSSPLASRTQTSVPRCTVSGP